MDYGLSKRWELWVQILTGMGWIAVGGDEGLLAFLLAAIPGGLLVTGGGASLLFPGEPGATRVAALGAVIGAIYAVAILLFEPGTALLLGAGSVLSFVAAGRLAAEDAEVPAPLERPEITTATAAEVAVDETVLGLVGMVMGVFNRGEQERVGRELDEALGWLETHGSAGDPERWNVPPDTVPEPVITRRQTRGLDWEEFSCESGFEPPDEAPGRDRYLQFHANQRAYAWVLRRPGNHRWLVCVHGLGMGHPALDMRLLDARHYFEDLGLNVLMPLLPFHGPRRMGKISGHGYVIGDALNTLHAQTQAMWDIRRFLNWIRADGAEALGVLGMSLGGYTTALLAGLEKDLDCAVAAIPAVALNELGDYHASPMASRRARAAGITVERLGQVLRPVSPLAASPKIPRDRRFIYGGLLDRFVPPDQVLQLWRHWDEPAIAWYAGAHLTFSRHPEIRRFVDQGLADAGVTAGPPR